MFYKHSVKVGQFLAKIIGFQGKRGEISEKYCVLLVFSESRSMFAKKTLGFLFSRIVISRCLGQEREHTDAPTHTCINSLGGGLCSFASMLWCVVVCRDRL